MQQAVFEWRGNEREETKDAHWGNNKTAAFMGMSGSKLIVNKWSIDHWGTKMGKVNKKSTPSAIARYACSCSVGLSGLVGIPAAVNFHLLGGWRWHLAALYVEAGQRKAAERAIMCRSDNNLIPIRHTGSSLSDRCSPKKESDGPAAPPGAHPSCSVRQWH